MSRPTSAPKLQQTKQIQMSLCFLALFLAPLFGFTQERKDAPDTSVTNEVRSDFLTVRKEVRAILSLPLKAVKIINGKDVSDSNLTFTKTFYSTKKGGKLFEVILNEAYVNKHPLEKVTVIQTYFFKDDELILFREKSSLRPRSTTEAIFKKGHPLPITKSSMDS